MSILKVHCKISADKEDFRDIKRFQDELSSVADDTRNVAEYDIIM